MQIKDPVRRYHRIEVIGSSDTGEWDDSPAPSREVKAEIRRFQREVLRPLGIKSRQRFGVSSNVFCAKRWVCVPRDQFKRAAEATLAWYEKNDRNLRYLHSADLKTLIEEDGCPA